MFWTLSYEAWIKMRWVKKIIIIISGMVLCCGCESREPLYLHLDMSNYEMSLEEYKYYIITKAIGDNRSKSWFDIIQQKLLEGKSYVLKS